MPQEKTQQSIRKLRQYPERILSQAVAQQLWLKAKETRRSLYCFRMKARYSQELGSSKWRPSLPITKASRNRQQQSLRSSTVPGSGAKCSSSIPTHGKESLHMKQWLDKQRGGSLMPVACHLTHTRWCSQEIERRKGLDTSDNIWSYAATHIVPLSTFPTRLVALKFRGLKLKSLEKWNSKPRTKLTTNAWKTRQEWPLPWSAVPGSDDRCSSFQQMKQEKNLTPPTLRNRQWRPQWAENDCVIIFSTSPDTLVNINQVL